MTVKTFKVEKLIRDKMPALLESKGIAVHAKAIADQEFISKLKDKLLEDILIIYFL
jgi:predicted house-cleaning noncanonical NTP pyrophosphatase (MazG superfamily)